MSETRAISYLDDVDVGDDDETETTADRRCLVALAGTAAPPQNDAPLEALDAADTRAASGALEIIVVKLH